MASRQCSPRSTEHHIGREPVEGCCVKRDVHHAARVMVWVNVFGQPVGARVCDVLMTGRKLGLCFGVAVRVLPNHLGVWGQVCAQRQRHMAEGPSCIDLHDWSSHHLSSPCALHRINTKWTVITELVDGLDDRVEQLR